jgi:fused signal recognition particle receptor
VVVLLIVVIVVLVLVLGGVAFVVPTRRRRELRRSGEGRAPTEGLLGEAPTSVVEAPPTQPEAPPTQPEAPPTQPEAPPAQPASSPEAEAALAPAPEALPEEPVVMARRLGRMRGFFSERLGGLRGRRSLDQAMLEELEETLILADVGVQGTMELLDALQAEVRANGIVGDDGVLDVLRRQMRARFGAADRSLRLAEGRTAVWLVVGVNGVGKTTTIGKLAARERSAGRRVVVAAGDTFRAAASDQLGIWAERAGVEVVRGAEGADPASVVFDAVAHGVADHADLVIADTAGRLHTKVNLMEELRKVKRVADRSDGELTEVLLVIDATTGQNGLVQARQFTEAVQVTGCVLTKLDGSAKGGIVLAVESELGVPVKLVGLGEGIGDLVPFDPDEFVAALVG